MAVPRRTGRQAARASSFDNQKRPTRPAVVAEVGSWRRLTMISAMP